MLIHQRTLQKEVSLWGTGLHTGKECMITFKPAPENYGYRFVRTDIENCPEIPALIDYVVDVCRGTTIEYNGTKVHTTEHVLAALYGLQIDNCRIEMSGPEPPVMDGSSLQFAEALLGAGLQEQEEPKNYLVIDETIEYHNPENSVDIVGLPLDGFRVTVMVDYKNPALGSQHSGLFDLDQEFLRDFAPCRTFCFLSEVEALANIGIIKGGDVDNAVVIVDKEMSGSELETLAGKIGIDSSKLQLGENGILNNRELRFGNEPARHKLLDMLGDLALLGMPIKAQILAARPGHASNVEFVRQLKKYVDRNKLARQYQHEKKSGVIFDINAIQNILPHRYPFLLIDKIVEFKLDEKIVSIKNVTMNEEFFQGHFPGNPIMPGVLIIEAMAQTGGIMMLNGNDNINDMQVYFMGIDKARFRKPVVPGDTLVIEAVMKSRRRSVCQFDGKAYVRGELVCEASLMATVVEKAKK
ncbi:bifunctional UDP-3-O-[3-hydroxymyristoyl] N-acetylglucosamine deacetylase/3-hydroxyacyl-ACP dehydratase [Prosthecochloris sp. HL-130-GSB]|jgi:UDP-3-O-[3-hydroxymyristoyl] N-acetylglucosamine deacetylase / 3-hydroxyacyl-[acyl-carrier-protein] dehydratase|uniref:Multifunctional fusion protein n=1 Tax=Prosthecochloris aestuarii TaxID=1102 RepID=A0A831WV98_PROAE|nr:bifunctional UDP-3-O-[3-hydroxymyristoyl] N-acetylglucosamine deacetylase/3-hydroxyacyl-ACP dehydratase [Prosthecochloris sp. HL-130-GSB]ARM30375.1 UDP-3-O-[3-hydroxymyristoyl] N-acetylglucosamine deacetylase [Prosthecochloris sp. HL-130-GSB]MBO8092004.1 bifunctional UDP-3-O-[3-hydroxymyristoyl] N-acetylglucosamine deacetylase/3-hydroxyacyl-ACP dehydratase [Prosthecochloris sp.]HED31451.1 bifunctional UDP-3-O-[3-hydroxymyristoyl] N-acetylglucosamine deacetylase/3-hydroxyacyl-ACP dehydratase [